MELESSRSVVPRLDVRASSPSTNSELLALAADDSVPSFTTLVTDDQTAGRGRLDRVWTAPAGSSLAISVLVRPAIGIDRAGWLPILAGLAMRSALRPELGARVGVKWPNDVLVGPRKICGILAEAAPAAGAVVIGAGLNTAMTDAQLPVPTATSLAVEGVAVDAGVVDRVLAAYLTALRELVGRSDETGGDARAAGLLAEAEAACVTLGREVRVELPGGESLEGVATGLDDDGRLVVRSGGAGVVVAAGDVIHVR